MDSRHSNPIVAVDHVLLQVPGFNKNTAILLGIFVSLSLN